MLVDVKLDIGGYNRITFESSLVQFLFNDTAKMKLEKLVFLYCGKFVKNHILTPEMDMRSHSSRIKKSLIVELNSRIM